MTLTNIVCKYWVFRMNFVILPRILYVDSDKTSREFFKNWLDRHERGYRLTCSDGAANALERIALGPFDFYLLEYCLGEMTGPELCRRIREKDMTTPVIVCSPLSREIDRNTALSAGASGYLVKPDELSRLAAIMRGFLGTNSRPRRLFHTARRGSAII